MNASTRARRRLLEAVQLPVPPRRHSRHSAEHTREVALIGEAERCGDRGDRAGRVDELPRGAADAKPADVLADRAAGAGAEDAREMRRVDAGEAGQLVQLDLFGGARVQVVD